MLKLVCNGTMCKCNSGTNFLQVGGKSLVSSDKKDILLEDSKPLGSFGICSILSKNQPVPCILALSPSWDNTSKIIEIENKKVLTEKSTLKCSVGGIIELVSVNSKIEVEE